MRNIIITDPPWNDSNLKQIIGRAVRYQSHERVKNIRNFVRIYRYYTLLPENIEPVSIEFDLKQPDKKGKKKQRITFDEKLSSDLMVKRKADKTHKGIQPLLKIMKQTSIDCQENYQGICFKSRNKTSKSSPTKRKNSQKRKSSRKVSNKRKSSRKVSNKRKTSSRKTKNNRKIKSKKQSRTKKSKKTKSRR